MDEKTVSAETAFSGKFLTLDVLGVELDSGVRTTREVVRHVGGAAVLARTEDGRYVFVRQFRKATEQALLEVVAGVLEEGEDPKDCAARELREETGYHANKITNLGEFFTSPGYSEERLYVFYADVPNERDDVAGVDDENLEVIHMAEADVEKMISNGEIVDGKTLVAWFLHKRERSSQAGRMAPI